MNVKHSPTGIYIDLFIMDFVPSIKNLSHIKGRDCRLYKSSYPELFFMYNILANHRKIS